MSCTYNTVYNKRGPRQGYIEKLEKRLENMERLLEPLQHNTIIQKRNDGDTSSSSGSNPRDGKNCHSNVYSTGSSTNSSESTLRPGKNKNHIYHKVLNRSSSSSPSSTNGTNSSTANEKEYDSNGSWSQNGMSTESPNSSSARTSQPIGYSLSDVLNPYSSSSSDNEDQAQEHAKPPVQQFHAHILNQLKLEGFEGTPELCADIFECYFQYVHPHFPIIHKPSLIEKINHNSIPKFLIFAMLANAARYCSQLTLITNTQYHTGEAFASIAKNILIDNCQVPSLESLQSLLLLSLHEFSNGRTFVGWLFGGMAQRMAQEMRLHKLDEQPSRVHTEDSWITLETKRRVWWVCFILDCYSSMVTGRPMTIDETESQVLIPHFNDEWENSQSSSAPPTYELTAHRPQSQSHFSSLIRLSIIVGKILRFISTLELRSKPTLPSVTSEFSFLDTSLYSWESMAPFPSQEEHTSLYHRLQSINVKLLFFTAVIVLHKTNIDFKEQTSSVFCDHHNHSLDKCTKAANGISNVFRNNNDISIRFLHCFSPFTLYVSSMIHIHNKKSSNSAILATATENLNYHYDLLNQCKNYQHEVDYIDLLRKFEKSFL